VYKYWFYHGPSLFDVTLDFVDGQDGYGCGKAEDGQSTTCGADARDAEWSVGYFQDAPMPSPVC
jgi:hypothetical protein